MSGADGHIWEADDQCQDRSDRGRNRRLRHRDSAEDCCQRLAYDSVARAGVEEELVRTLASNEDGYYNLAVLGRCKTNVRGSCSIAAGGSHGRHDTHHHQTNCTDVTGFHDASLAGSLWRQRAGWSPWAS